MGDKEVHPWPTTLDLNVQSYVKKKACINQGCWSAMWKIKPWNGAGVSGNIDQWH